MNRRRFLHASTAGLAGAMVSSSVLAKTFVQAPAAPPTVTRFEELRRGVGIFIGRGGTIGYLVNGDGAIAVDSQFMDTAATCVAGLKTRAPKGIDLLINTHHHADHTGGNKVFKPLVKHIVAQENCLVWHKKVAEQANTVADQAYADVTFGGSWSQTFGDEKVWAHYFGPGHTSGDAVIYFEKANVVHGGDLLFRRVHPRIDVPAGASAVNWVKALDKIAREHHDDTIFVFGHGQDNMTRGAKADVLFFKDYLSAGIDHVRKGIGAKKSKDEIVKVEALKGFESVVSLSAALTLAGTLGSIYDELSKG
ncbi:MAG: MBL fold metallo-hydrolase [Vicinamibacterales bacterium]